MLFLFEKNRHGNEYISITLPIEEARKGWRIRRFTARIIVEQRDAFSTLWKRALTEDGEKTLTGRLHCFYKHFPANGGYSIKSIPRTTIMQNIVDDVPIYVILLPRSRLCLNPIFHPRARKSHVRNKSSKPDTAK